MPIAKITDDSPLTVRLRGDTIDTPVQVKADALPALAAGDDVWVEVDDAEHLVVVLAKLVTA